MEDIEGRVLKAVTNLLFALHGHPEPGDDTPTEEIANTLDNLAAKIRGAQQSGQPVPTAVPADQTQAQPAATATDQPDTSTQPQGDAAT